MTPLARNLVTTALAALTAVTLAAAPTVVAPPAGAVTAIVAPGTGTPDANVIPGYLENARDYYMTTTPCTAAADCDLIGINYPASFWPLFFRPRWCVPGRCEKWDVSVADGLGKFNSELINLLTADPDEEIVMFGYSQGGAIVSDQLRNLVALDPTLKDRLSVVLIGNIDNPVGGPWSLLGFLGHIPIVDVTTGMPTIVDTGIRMTSVHFEYDGVGDAPIYWGNLPAVLNAAAGFWYVHGQMLWPNGYNETGLPNGYTPQELADQMNPSLHPENFSYDDYGNPFIIVPTRTLPIMQPFLDFGAATGLGWLVQPFVDLISPALRVIIDTAYDRTANPGVPQYLSPLPFNPKLNLAEVAVDFVRAVGEGVDAFLGHLESVPDPVASTAPAPSGAVRAVRADSAAPTEEASGGVPIAAPEAGLRVPNRIEREVRRPGTRTGAARGARAGQLPPPHRAAAARPAKGPASDAAPAAVRRAAASRSAA